MIKTRFFLIAVFFLFPSLCFLKTPVSPRSSVNASWKIFYTAIQTAVNNHDSAAMLKMMPDDFHDDMDSSAGKAEWLKLIVEAHAKNGSWQKLRKSFASVTKIHKNKEGIPRRYTKDHAYYFEYRKDKKWYFAGVVGD